MHHSDPWQVFSVRCLHPTVYHLQPYIDFMCLLFSVVLVVSGLDNKWVICEPRHEKTGFLPVRKQKCRKVPFFLLHR